MKSKTCFICKIKKPLTEFPKNKHNKDGLFSYCFDCNLLKCKKYHATRQLQNHDYYIKNKKRLGRWLKKNRLIIKKKKAEYFQRTKDEHRRKQKIWEERNKEKHSLYQKQYYETHKSQRNKKLRFRRKMDINFKILTNLRTRFNAALRKNQKSGTTIKRLGCSIEFLKKYLEAQFKEGMCWTNYGIGGWVIDHKLPCCSFDLRKEENQLKCFHYTNLQPLWEVENLRKLSLDKQLSLNKKAIND
jgi:hypothetical protein